MSGWQVLGWALIADVVLVILSLGAGLARAVWQASDTRETSHSIFRGRSEQ